MKKKAAVVMLSLLMALTCTACGGESKESSASSSTASVTSGTEDSPQPSAEASQEEKSKEASDKKSESSSEESKESTDAPETEEPEEVELSINSLTMSVGQQFQPIASVKPEGLKDVKLVWESTDSSVAKVDAEGLITAVGEGQADITVKVGSKGAFCTVIVESAETADGSSEQEESKTESKAESSSEKKQESRTAPEITGTRVDASWFDDAVFIGDSVTTGLYNYADDGCLGEAEFLARECMGYHTALFGLDHEYGIHPSYRGEKVMLDDGVQMTGKKNVFIMLGMNDICSWGVDDSVEAMIELVDTILAKSPDVNIYIESVTPMIASKHREDYLNNTNIALFNEQAKAVCEERGYVFLDIFSVVEDGSGNLRDDLCSDPGGLGHHMNSDGMALWVEYLYTHVQ